MKKYFYYLIFLQYIILSSSCSSEKNVSENVLELYFDLDKNRVNFEDSDLINNCLIIPLQTNNDILINKIDKVLLHDDKIFVGDFFLNRCVFVFDKNGELVHTFDNYGRGPEEFLSLSDFYIDVDNNTINLLSNIEKRIVVFDLDSYSFIKKFEINKYLWNVLKLKDYYIGFSGNVFDDPKMKYNLWILDSNFNIIDYKFEIEKFLNATVVTNTKYLSYYDSIAHYMISGDREIYGIKDNRIDLLYRLDFGKYNFPKNISSYQDFIDKSRSGKFVSNIYNFQETERYLFIRILHGIEIKYCIFDKLKNKCLVYNNDFYKGVYYLPIGTLVNTNEKYFISYIEAEDLLFVHRGGNEYVDLEDIYQTQLVNLRDRIPNLNENDNPIIVVYYFNN